MFKRAIESSAGAFIVSDDAPCFTSTLMINDELFLHAITINVNAEEWANGKVDRNILVTVAPIQSFEQAPDAEVFLSGRRSS